jgi:hypothetical protein
MIIEVGKVSEETKGHPNGLSEGFGATPNTKQNN